jgi:hypothetical protein
MKENTISIPVEGSIQYSFMVSIQDHGNSIDYQFTINEPTFKMEVP